MNSTLRLCTLTVSALIVFAGIAHADCAPVIAACPKADATKHFAASTGTLRFDAVVVGAFGARAF